MRRPAVMAGAAVLLLLSAALDAQWLKYPTPGIPRLPDGRADLSAPTPRTADGKPDLSGLWRASVNYISDLTRGAKPGDVVMLPATDALVRERRENFSRDDPSASCIPGGVPRSDLVSTAYPMRVVTAPGRVVVLYEAIHGWRNDKGWLDNAGHPNTARLRVTERFRRKDFGHMDIDITFDDPGAYAKPWTVTLPLLYQSDTELLEYICNENNRYFEIVPRK